jgi:hypothetical protein
VEIPILAATALLSKEPWVPERRIANPRSVRMAPRLLVFCELDTEARSP